MPKPNVTATEKQLVDELNRNFAYVTDKKQYWLPCCTVWPGTAPCAACGGC